MGYLNSSSELALRLPQTTAGALTGTVLSTAQPSHFAEDIRTLKAAWFYSDEVRVMPWGLFFYAWTPLVMVDEAERDVVSAVRNALAVEPEAVHDERVGFDRRRPLTAAETATIQDFIDVGLAVTHTTLLDANEIARAAATLTTGNWDSALLGVPVTHAKTLQALHADLDGLTDTFYATPGGERFMLPSGQVAGSAGALREGALVTELLASLPAFPDADWDVLADVREQMKSPLAQFRSAIVKAAQELERFPDAEISTSLDSFRRNGLNDGLAAIEGMLDDLRALPTLYRLAASAQGVATTATLALAASGVVSASAASVGAAPLIAAAASELHHRRRVRAEAALHPMWLLRELPEAIRKHW